MGQKTLKKQLIPIPASVKTLLLICEKCGKKQGVDAQENSSIRLQKKLKARIKETLKPGEGRAITTSCMGICPEAAITIGYIDSLHQNMTVQFYILEEKDLEKAADYLFQQFFLKN